MSNDRSASCPHRAPTAGRFPEENKDGRHRNVHTLPVWLQRKTSLFQLSFCLSFEPSGLHHSCTQLPLPPHVVRGRSMNHLGPQTAAQCINTCESGPQGSKLVLDRTGMEPATDAWEGLMSGNTRAVRPHKHVRIQLL